MKIVFVLNFLDFLGSHVANKLYDARYQVRIFNQRQSTWIHSDQEIILASKYVPPINIDFSQGLIQVIGKLSLKQLTHNYVG